MFAYEWNFTSNKVDILNSSISAYKKKQMFCHVLIKDDVISK